MSKNDLPHNPVGELAKGVECAAEVSGGDPVWIHWQMRGKDGELYGDICGDWKAFSKEREK